MILSHLADLQDDKANSTKGLERLTSISRALTVEICLSREELLDAFPIEKYIGFIDRYPDCCSYTYVSKEVREYCQGIRLRCDSRIFQLYHKLLLVKLMMRSSTRLHGAGFLDDIKSLYKQDFQRIIEQMESQSKDLIQYEYSHDGFMKDLGVCSMRIIPCGVVKIHLDTIPKSFFLKKSIKQFVEGIMLVLIELGRHSPLYQMHTVSHDPYSMSQFNPDGWIRFYKLVAKMLKKQSQVRGIFGTSWFFDPQLENISPRLVYLRKIATANGARLFYIGPSASAVTSSTLKSPTRRRLYAEGKYLPTEYMLIWSSKRLIQWAEV